MSIITKILAGIAILIAIPFIMATFITRDYHITREITIQQPKEIVFDYLKYLKNQDNYSVWVRMDPTMAKTFSGTDGLPGFTYAWEGNSKAGKGNQKIVSIKEGDSIDIAVNFIKPFEATAHTPFTTTAITAGETRVKWEAIGKSNYPMNFMNLFADKLMGGDMMKSLEMLKSILENPTHTLNQ